MKVVEKKNVYRPYSLKKKMVVNRWEFRIIIISSHYEEEHGSYMTDEKIYILVHELLRTQRFVFAGRMEKWEYFEADILWIDKNYRLVFCLEDGQGYLGIVDCYRKSKYDKKD